MIERHSRSTNPLSRQQPQLSILMATASHPSMVVKASLVNCESDRLPHEAHVLNIKGRSYQLRDLELSLGVQRQ